MAIIFKGEGDTMVRVKVVLLLFLAGVVSGFCGLAAESDGLSGTIGAEAAFLPGFSMDVWLDLDWNVDGFSIGSLTELTVLPGFTAGETITAWYSFGPFDLGGTVMIDVYPFAFGGLDLHAEVGLFDIAQDGVAISAGAGLYSEIYPTFANTLSLDVDASYGIFSLWGDFDLGIPDFGVSALIGGEVRVLDLDLDNGGLTADLGASTFVLPAVDALMWLDVAFTLGAVTVTSETDFTLTPFGLTEQRFEVEIGFDGFSVYVWASFNGAGDLSAGIGGTYDFP
jgi:hypothetical protein